MHQHPWTHPWHLDRSPSYSADFLADINCPSRSFRLFLVRAFIIFHDCGHGSFFKNKKANDALGFFTGMLTFTPYHHWKWEHAVHHATNGDLDKRGIGDVWTMTVEEYITSSRWIKLSYRLLRNPFILFGLAPLFLFFVLEGFLPPSANPVSAVRFT